MFYIYIYIYEYVKIKFDTGLCYKIIFYYGRFPVDFYCMYIYVIYLFNYLFIYDDAILSPG